MQVFVSHRTDADAAIANRLAAGLDAVGIATWIAPRDVDPGTTWPRAIEHGLQTSTHAAVLLSATTLASRAVQLELQMAEMLQVEGHLELIPVLLGDVELPPWLAIMQWVDLRGSYQDGFASLTAALRRERPSSARPATDVAPVSTGDRTYRIGGRSRVDVIAAELLGSPHDWRRLLERHPEVDPLRLPPGLRLIVTAREEIGGAGG